MLRSTLKPLAALAVLLALPALASDGQTPIPFTDPYVTPQVITSPGSYVVTRNLAPDPAGGVPIIQIDCMDPNYAPASGATVIDLNGFTLEQFAAATSPVIEVIPNGTCEIVIRNGELLGGSNSIAVPAPTRLVRIEDVQMKDSAAEAVFIFDTEKFVLRRNVIIGAGGPGIVVGGGAPKSGAIEGNVVQRTTDIGINVEGSSSVEVSNNRVHEVFPGAGGGAPFAVGILIRSTGGCLIAQNTVEEISGIAADPNTGQGIRLEQSICKLYNNVIHSVQGDGIFMYPGTGDCLVLNNTVSGAGRDGLHVEGFQNHFDRNVLNSNGAIWGGWGMHFLPGTTDNRSGRNSAVGNVGGGCAFAPVGPPFTDYCDDAGAVGTVNVSFGDNLVSIPF
jgi:parallel beta-helix repeat protein